MSKERGAVLVLGAGGLLGEALVRALTAHGLEYAAPRRAELDLAGLLRTDALDRRLEQLDPRAVLNASAYTDVARSELPAEREAVYALNRDVPAALARWCARRGRGLIHVSTDYVFDGRARRPYREDDPVNPLQVYGRSKLAGEDAVREALPTAVVARTSTLYGPGRRRRPHYVDAVLRQAHEYGKLRVVRPPVSSPTYAPDLAEALLELLGAGADGLFHTVNAGACSRYELACAAVRLAGLSDRVDVGERPEEPGGLARPAYSVLDATRYAELTGRPVRSWDEALREYLGAA
jgi:dTDP-4-dehydrorhamnose reductase